ncbi:MAG: hypothetical protein DMG54_32910 [Acidobacteria bacterium]|nr:MAG: hypothetical protein DMG54_32910 [Acidobacteriota bacterium]PYU68075.1 MAG: hypothetical protein DMG52_32520 [Acidobacteriota bacterium]
MAADVDNADSLILRRLATQLLDLIEHLQNLLVQHRDLRAGPTKAQILCTLLTQFGYSGAGDRTHLGPPLFTPGQDHVAVQPATRTTTIGVTATPGDLVDIAFDQRGAGQRHVQDLAQMVQKREQCDT